MSPLSHLALLALLLSPALAAPAYPASSIAIADSMAALSDSSSSEHGSSSRNGNMGHMDRTGHMAHAVSSITRSIAMKDIKASDKNQAEMEKTGDANIDSSAHSSSAGHSLVAAIDTMIHKAQAQAQGQASINARVGRVGVDINGHKRAVKMEQEIDQGQGKMQGGVQDSWDVVAAIDAVIHRMQPGLKRPVESVGMGMDREAGMQSGEMGMENGKMGMKSKNMVPTLQNRDRQGKTEMGRTDGMRGIGAMVNRVTHMEEMMQGGNGRVGGGGVMWVEEMAHKKREGMEKNKMMDTSEMMGKSETVGNSEMHSKNNNQAHTNKMDKITAMDQSKMSPHSNAMGQNEQAPHMEGASSGIDRRARAEQDMREAENNAVNMSVHGIMDTEHEMERGGM